MEENTIKEKLPSMESKFTGKVSAYFGLSVGLLALCFFTLGIATPWVIAIYTGWIIKNTIISGRKLSFDGTGLQLLGNILLWVLLDFVTLGIYSFWSIVREMRWYVKHIHIEGSNAGSEFTGGVMESIGLSILTGLITFFSLGIATPWAVCMIYNWYADNTVIDGHRIQFNGTGGALFGKYIKWFLLSIITLGIYSFWAGIEMQKWLTSNTRFIN